MNKKLISKLEAVAKAIEAARKVAETDGASAQVHAEIRRMEVQALTLVVGLKQAAGYRREADRAA